MANRPYRPQDIPYRPGQACFSRPDLQLPRFRHSQDPMSAEAGARQPPPEVLWVFQLALDPKG